jgi:hypothetical protein
VVTLISIRTRRAVAVGVFGVAAGAAAIAPALISTTHTGAEVTASPACLAWFGNREDGKCLSYSNGTPAQIGTPWVGSGQNGVITGPMLPGTTINQSIG